MMWAGSRFNSARVGTVRRIWRPLVAFAVTIGSVMVGGLGVSSPALGAQVPFEGVFSVPGLTKLFGADIDIHGDWAIVGAPSVGSSNGGVQIFEYDEADWVLRREFTSFDGSPNRVNFGQSVAVHGNRFAASSASGTVIWTRSGSVFSETAVVSTARDDIELDADFLYGLTPFAGLGVFRATDGVRQRTLATATQTDDSRLAIGRTGNEFTIVVGHPDASSGAGLVEIFQRTGTFALAWATTPDVALSNPDTNTSGDTRFGASVSVANGGDTIAVGHPGEGSSKGAAWVYQFDGSVYVPFPKVVPDARQTQASFGASVSLDSFRLAVGAPGPDLNTTIPTGAAVFDLDGVAGQYEQVEAISPVIAEPRHRYGAALDFGPNDALLVGAPGLRASGQVHRGSIHHVQVAQPVATNKLLSSSSLFSTEYGTSVAMSGTTAAVGHPDGAGRVEILTQAGDGSWSLDHVIDDLPGGIDPDAGLGFDVALDGDLLAVVSDRPGNINQTRVDVFERADAASPFVHVAHLSTGIRWKAVDIDGSTIAAAQTNAPGQAGTARVQVFERTGPTTWATAADVALPGDSRERVDVAISGDVVAVGAPRAERIEGRVWMLVRTGGVWPSAVTNTISNPDVADPTDSNFGSAVALDGQRLVIGHDGEGGSGAVWFYDQTTGPGTYGPPQKLKASNLDNANAFGSNLDIDGDVVIAASRFAGNRPGAQGRTGSAHIITQREGSWVETQLLQASDRSQADGWFGNGVAVQGLEVLIGAPFDDNELGPDAGAVYWTRSRTAPGVDNPDLVVNVLSPDGPTQFAGATGIRVDRLRARSIEGYGGARSNVVSTPLDSVDGASTDTEPSAVLVETSVADLGLGGSGTDGVGRELLESILLSDVVIEGGWDAALAGSVFEGLPLQNVTLGQVLDAGLVDGEPLDAIDLSSTPIGSIPIASIALSSTPIGSIPLPGGQSWCDLLGAVSPAYNCATSPAADPNEDSLVDLAIQGTPIGSIPIGSIPIGSIPIASIPIGSIPIGSIDVEGAPIGSIPIASIPIGSIPIGSIPIASIPIGSIPIGSIDVGGTPIGSIPIGSITIGEIALGDLADGGAIAASPIGSIPIGSIDLQAAPIGSIPIASIPIGSIPIASIDPIQIDIEGVSIASTPIGSIDLAASPIGSIPIGSIPIGSIPIGSIPIGSIPIASIPIGSIPIGSIPIGSIPIASIDLTSNAVGSIPITAIPTAQLSAVVDCALIDCTADFDLLDASLAGALNPGATLAAFEGADTRVRLADLIGIDGLGRPTIRSQVDSLITPSFDSLVDLLTADDLTLRDLPAGLPQLSETRVEHLGAALVEATLGDLLVGLDAGESELRNNLIRNGYVRLRDLDSHAGIVLGDLPDDAADFDAQEVEQLLPALDGLRLGDLLDLHQTLGGGDLDWGASTLADVSAWFDIPLGDLGTYGDTTLAELLGSLTSPTDLTFADVLLSLVGTDGHDWSDVDLGAFDLEAASAPQTFTSTFQVIGGLGFDRTVVITSSLPIDAEYAEGSTVVRAADGGDLPGGAGEPSVQDNQLVWTLSGVRSDVRYEIDIDLIPAVSLGSSTIVTEGSIVGTEVASAGVVSVGIEEAFEPNDVPGDSGIVSAATDTIYASHIATAGDVDLFAVDLQAGSRLSVALSDLPADYDLVVYGPPTEELAPPLRSIDPSEAPEIALDPSSNDNGAVVQGDVPLLGLPVAGVSARRDTENEQVTVASVRTTGTYYVQVSGYAGATSPDPYALFIGSDEPPAAQVCRTQNYQSIADRGSLPTTAQMAGVNTLVLVNEERLVGKYGADASTALDAVADLVTYTNVTNRALGTTSIVVPVEGDDAVRAAYDALDSAPCEPSSANGVVAAINDLVDGLRAADPATDIEQIMIVGDDDIVPMARIADDTTIANERTYANTFLDTESNSLAGALRTGHFLSDDPYGDVDPIRSGDRILYVTDVGLGRLVERPEEIAGQIATFIGFDGQLDPSTALVTGYDFLTDGATAVSDAIDALPDTDSVDELIDETWTADDVFDELFPGGADSPNIASINAHFDHYRALPADQNATGSEDDLFSTADVDAGAVAGRLAARSLFSMGCHGGLHVPDELFAGTIDGIALDWAQAFARQGAVWVGNTGFGYGETEGVELTERLMVLYAERLDGSVKAGDALFYAKQEYLGTQQAAYGAFDEKVLQQATFYGIPFYELAVDTEPDAAPVPAAPATAPVPGSDIEVAAVDAEVDFVANIADGGTSFVAALPSGDDGVVGTQSTPFSPILPTLSYDVSDVDPTGVEAVSIAQGAVISELVTTDIVGIDPDLARPIVDDSGVEVEPRVGQVSTDPAVFVSNYETPEGPRQSVTTLLGTFRSTQPDGTGTQRLFDEIEIETYYRDPSSEADQVAPTFASVTSTTKTTAAGEVLVVDAVVVDDVDDNVVRVFALVAADASTGTRWTPVEMARGVGDRWSGSTLVGAGEIELIVQAVDGNGNASLSTNKARGFSASTAPESVGEIAVTSTSPLGGLLDDVVTITATVGGPAVDYQIDGGDIVVGASQTEVVLDPAALGDGGHTVTFRTEAGARRTESVVFDTTPPSVSIVSPADGASLASEVAVVLDFVCADAASGIVSCTGLLDGASVADGDIVSLESGTHTLVVTATDAVGASTSSTSTFEILEPDPDPDPDPDSDPDPDPDPAPDTVPPVIVVDIENGEVRASAEPGKPDAVVTFTVTATDAGVIETPGTAAAPGRFAAALSVPVTCSPPSGSRFAIGTTPVTCTATDAAGNVATASFDVVVSDEESPVITPRPALTVEVGARADGVVEFDLPNATDNSGSVTVTCDPASGSIFDDGPTTVTCVAVDGSGNTARTSFVVTVRREEIEGALPATGSGRLPLREGSFVASLGLALLILGRRRRGLKVEIRSN